MITSFAFLRNINTKHFLEKINEWHPSIDFTTEHQTDHRLAFLDVLAIRDNKTDKYITTLYRKPTNTSLCLLYGSNQCRKYKLGLIRTLAIGILLICSTSTHKDIELTLMKETLKMNGYPQHLIRRGIREGEAIVKKILNSTRKKPTKLTYEEQCIFYTYVLWIRIRRLSAKN